MKFKAVKTRQEDPPLCSKGKSSEVEWGAWHYPNPEEQLELHSVIFLHGVPFADDGNIRLADLGWRMKPDDPGVEMQNHFVRMDPALRVIHWGGHPDNKPVEY